MIFYKIVSFGVAFFAIEGMQMWLTSLLMSWISIVIINLVGFFTYASIGSIFKTFPILLAIIVRALFMEVWELDFHHVREHRLRPLSVGIEVRDVLREEEIHATPLNQGDFPGCFGSFFI
jgi:hypothetical protein